jgi:hypothetical protein
VEGFWYQGTAYYTLDNHTQCRDMFRKVLRLAPKNRGMRSRPVRVRLKMRPVAAPPPVADLGVGDTPGSAARSRCPAHDRTEQFS